MKYSFLSKLTIFVYSAGEFLVHLLAYFYFYHFIVPLFCVIFLLFCSLLIGFPTHTHTSILEILDYRELPGGIEVTPACAQPSPTPLSPGCWGGACPVFPLPHSTF
jgi:hypothetical protein